MLRRNFLNCLKINHTPKIKVNWCKTKSVKSQFSQFLKYIFNNNFFVLSSLVAKLCQLISFWSLKLIWKYYYYYYTTYVLARFFGVLLHKTVVNINIYFLIIFCITQLGCEIVLAIQFQIFKTNLKILLLLHCTRFSVIFWCIIA